MSKSIEERRFQLTDVKQRIEKLMMAMSAVFNELFILKTIEAQLEEEINEREVSNDRT